LSRFTELYKVRATSATLFASHGEAIRSGGTVREWQTGQEHKRYIFFLINIIIIFVTYLLLTFTSFQMDLTKKFQEATSSQVIKINTMEVNKNYLIIRAKQLKTKFEPTVLLHIKETLSKVVKVFLPRRYSSIFSDEYIELIKSQRVSLKLIYKGTCEKTNSYILAIE
jgi:hypothetical protein